MLEKEEDFSSLKTILEEELEKQGSHCIFTPKFHPKLNPIESRGFVQRIIDADEVVTPEKYRKYFVNMQRYLISTVLMNFAFFQPLFIFTQSDHFLIPLPFDHKLSFN